MAKIPKSAYLPVSFVSHPGTTIMAVAKWLEIEAASYRREHNRDGANALMATARHLRKIGGDGLSPAEAFDWPKQESKA
jgi:hypothetical protein